MSSTRAASPSRAWRILPIAAMVLGGSLLAAAPASAEAAVNLRTATQFAVLAGTGITNTGRTVITGDIGSHPEPAIDDNEIVLTGANHGADAVTGGAKTDLVTAYNFARDALPQIAEDVELGDERLTSGVYRSPTFGLTGTLTLDGENRNGVGNLSDSFFIFQAWDETLITAADSRVELVGGADPCRVVWQVGSSATFGERTAFVGDVLVMTSITANAGATFQGRLLARNGAVTLINNTINNSACAPIVIPPPVTTPETTPETTPTTEATTPTTEATTPTSTAGTPAAAPVTSTGATPGSPTATPGTPANPFVPNAAGPPTVTRGPGSPGTPGSPGSPTAPGAPGGPFLPDTGIASVGTAGAALLLLGLGSLAVQASRRMRTPYTF